MGLRLISDDKPVVIYKKERTSQAGNKWYTYCTRVSSKDEQGNWKSAFIDIAFKKGVEVNNKAKISIKNSFPILDTYNDKTSLKWMIMDFNVVEEGEKPAEPVSLDGAGDDDFMKIPEGFSNDVPFGN